MGLVRLHVAWCIYLFIETSNSLSDIECVLAIRKLFISFILVVLTTFYLFSLKIAKYSFKLSYCYEYKSYLRPLMKKL